MKQAPKSHLNHHHRSPQHNHRRLPQPCNTRLPRHRKPQPRRTTRRKRRATTRARDIHRRRTPTRCITSGTHRTRLRTRNIRRERQTSHRTRRRERRDLGREIRVRHSACTLWVKHIINNMQHAIRKQNIRSKKLTRTHEDIIARMADRDVISLFRSPCRAVLERGGECDLVGEDMEVEDGG